MVVLTGACFLAGLIGSFAEYLSSNDESGQSAFDTKIQKLQDYMKYRRLPLPLQNEILFFHHHKWMNSHVLDEKAVQSILPIPLQMDLSFETLQPTLKHFPILSETQIAVQKRISHALTRQVCPQNAIIYNAGDIGWDIYFIGLGLIKVSLPTNLDILDEEGKANISYTKNKAASVGLLYRPGNHFGESCLKSHSGVRQETVIAKSTVTLYLISKESLQNIFNLMSREQRDKLINNLLSKNGNIWHSFDSKVDSPEEKSSNKYMMEPSRSPSYILNKSERFTILQAQRSRHKIKSGMLRTSRRRSTRLRSFSAEASAQAIRNRLSLNMSHSLSKLKEEKEDICEGSFYIQDTSKVWKTVGQLGFNTNDDSSSGQSEEDKSSSDNTSSNLLRRSFTTIGGKSSSIPED